MGRTTTTPRTDSRERILDAAERAFAEGGFAGTSLRSIVREAGVTLPSVYYYFGSKEGLLAAVCERRLGPLRREGLDLLRRCEEEARGKPVPVEEILTAMLSPPLRVAAGAARHAAVMRLIGRIATVPDPRLRALLRGSHEEMRAACLAAMRRTLPGIPVPELRWRLEFVWGALAFVLCDPRNIAAETRGACDPGDAEALLRQMIQFFSAGLRARPARAPSRPRGRGRGTGGRHGTRARGRSTGGRRSTASDGR
jgi:AcrR family transcriptional regulator